MVPVRKFSSSTSLFLASFFKISRPSGALRLSVMLFLLRFTDMKYVDSPPENGGQPRVSSPLPGSSTLMTSAPMSPSSMAQYGPASTRVRSRTRTSFNGCSAGMWPPVPHPLGQAPRDGVGAIAGVTGAPPEQPRALERAEVGEVVDVVDRFDRHRGADLKAARLGAVADEPRATLQLDDGDVQRRAEALGCCVQHGERHDLADPGHRRRRHGHRMPRTVRGRRSDHGVAARTPRGRDTGGRRLQTASRMVIQLLVARPPIECASATRPGTWRAPTRRVSCHTHSTICAMPVAASGWPRPLSPPDGLIGRRPSRAVSPSSVTRPALPGGTRPMSSSEISSNGAKASWISAKSTRSGPKPAIWNAARAATRLALKLVRESRCRTASVSVPCPTPATRTGVRSEVTTSAAAPSEIGQQCRSRSGSATIRLSMTSSAVTTCWKCAYGLRAAFAWFFTATCAISRGVTSLRARSARVMSPASAGMVAPYERSYGSMDRPMISETFGVARWVIFSPPTTSTESYSPDATCATAA